MKTKKLLAFLLSLAMVLAMGFTTFAASAVPSSDDVADVTIKGVEANATVTLYKIVEPVYNSAGLEKYQPVVTGSIADVKVPTTAEIAALAQSATSIGSPLLPIATVASGNDYVAKDLGAGMYLVLVEGTGATVYNPMIVSVNYDKDSVIEDGSVDAKTNWVLDDVIAYAKSGTPGVDKKIMSEDSNLNANSNGGDVAIGDTVNFEIDTAIPSYSEQYTNLKFDVTDTLSAGFDPASDIVVKVNNSVISASDDTYTIITGSGTFTVSFTEEFIRANGGKSVVVTYSAVVNSDAALNFDPNSNKAEITFSNDPTDSSKYGTVDDRTYTYTFAIDGILGGTVTTESYRTHEIIKVYEDGKVEVISQADDPLDTIEVTNPLAGATFTLTNKATQKSYTATSDTEGYLSGFTGLDAGVYELVEASAPAGYVVDPTVHEVVISATYNDNGTLASYSITIDGVTTSTYTATYDILSPEITKVEGTQDTLVIKNSKIPVLPSTGGIGTTAFYVIGAVLVLGAGILLITRKRMSNKK
ncbi:MAG: isopeptide-forming domain-containing fimbrial protein [Lachnospiraceae bacterium]|nr:isopeptide-forming domain-containing fimbrial protein [Lachnospiraceae bacterium]